MKKFMKFCAITALVLVLLGLILGLVGRTATGAETISDLVNKVTGGNVQFNLSPEDWGVRIDSDFLDGLGDVNFEIEDSISFDDEHGIQSGKVEKYLLEGAITKLEIEVGGCDFRVETSGDENFYVEAENAGKFQAYVEEMTLYLKTTTAGVKTWNELSGSKITLYVPENFLFEEVGINLGAGVLNFPNLQAGEVSLEVGAGQIVVDNAVVYDMEINVGAGQVKMKNMQLDELDAEVGMGEFRASGTVRGNVDAECSMGNMELRLTGEQKDYNYDLSGAMGNLNLNGENFSGFAQERNIDNGADKTIRIDCSMGNVSVKFEK